MAFDFSQADPLALDGRSSPDIRLTYRPVNGPEEMLLLRPMYVDFGTAEDGDHEWMIVGAVDDLEHGWRERRLAFPRIFPVEA